MNTASVMNAFRHQLEALHERVFFMRTPSTAGYPYILIRYASEEPFEDIQNDFMVNVDIYHRRESGVDVLGEIEGIADDLDSLDGAYNEGEGFYYTAYKVSRMPIPEDNDDIERREVRFQIQASFTGGN